MDLQKLKQGNLPLLVGLLAPVLLMGLFFISAALTKSPTLPPPVAYDILFADTSDYQNHGPVNAMLFVEGQRLYVRYTQDKNRGYDPFPQLYLYEAKTQKLRQLDFPPPDAKDVKLDEKMLVKSAVDLKLDASPTSPDGYEFTYSGASYRHGGIINELFIGGGGSDYGPRLRKGEQSYPMPVDGSVAHYGLRFLGWVVAKDNP